MGIERCFINTLFLWLALGLGLLLGVASGFLFLAGLLPGFAAAIPIAGAVALAVFLLTPIVAALTRHSCCRFNIYAMPALLGAAAFLVTLAVAAVIAVTTTAQIVLAFVAGIAFWVMRVTFLAGVFSIDPRR